MGDCALLDPSWTVEVIAVDDRPEEVRLAFAPDGAPAIAWVSDYMNITQSLEYAWRDAGAWVHESVMGSNPGLGRPGIAFGGDGTPYLLFGWEHSLGGAMSIAQRRDGAWTTTMLVADRAASVSSLATRSDGAVMGLFNLLWELQSVAPDGLGGWAQSVVDDGMMTNRGGMASAGIGNDLAFDDADVAHASYYDATDAVFYARGEAGTWTRETIATEVAYDVTAIAIDPAGEPHVAYADDDAGSLLLASRDAGVWSSQTIETDGGGGVNAQLAIDGAGVRHVAHFRGEGSELRYDDDVDGDFALVTVAAPIEYAALSLELDADDRPWLVWAAGEHLCLAQRG